MLTGEIRETIFTYPDLEKPEEYIIVIEIRKGRSPEFKVNLTGEKPQFEVKLVLEGEIMSIQSGINYELDEAADKLDTYLEQTIRREVIKVIEKTQKEFKSDIIGFGEYTRPYFWTWQDWEDYHWLERYPDAEIEVKVQLDIRRTGLMIKTEEINTSDGGGE
jgi:spore germination protein KC